MKKLSLIFIYAFLLNLVWENLHAFLYFHPNGEPITQAMLLQATLFDAIFITILGFLFIKIPYFRERIWYALVFGFIVAVFIEVRAINESRWAYNDLMPVIPLLNTGLTPTVQLGVLAYFIFKIVGINKNDKKLIQCKECGFHYQDREWAEKCEAWCKKYNSCNLEITNYADENKLNSFN